MLDQVCCGGFAIGTGDTDQCHPAAGMAPVGSRQFTDAARHRFSQDQHWLISGGGQLLRGGGADHGSSSTCLQCLPPETTAIKALPRQPQEQRSLTHQARIAGDGGELGIGQTSRQLQAYIAQQGMQRLTHAIARTRLVLSRSSRVGQRPLQPAEQALKASSLGKAALKANQARHQGINGSHLMSSIVPNLRGGRPSVITSTKSGRPA